MDQKILKLLYQNGKLTADEIATRLGVDAPVVAGRIKEMEKAGIIRGYQAVFDWDKLYSVNVSAIIELKVTPKAELGFEEIAEKVMK